ncbi:hypothetical protein [uncultured Cohaesibacter sp.]|nr:hypothetical protein [uncultured Cohaesibacter sp.]
METQIIQMVAYVLLIIIGLSSLLVSLALIRMILRLYKDTVYEWRRR